MKNFPVVDLVEQDRQFLEEAKKALEPTKHKGKFFNIGKEFFLKPTEAKLVKKNKVIIFVLHLFYLKACRNLYLKLVFMI